MPAAASSRGPPRWLHRWRFLMKMMFRWMTQFFKLNMYVKAFDRMHSLKDTMIKVYRKECQSSISLMTTPAREAAKKANGNKGKYQKKPEACLHDAGLRSYGARGGPYRICDLCGQRWRLREGVWQKIEPRPAPGQYNEPTSARSARSSQPSQPCSAAPASSRSAPAGGSKRGSVPRLLQARTKAKAAKPAEVKVPTSDEEMNLEAGSMAEEGIKTDDSWSMPEDSEEEPNQYDMAGDDSPVHEWSDEDL